MTVYRYGGVVWPTYTYDPTKYKLVERGTWARLVNELADLRKMVAERGWDDQRNVTIPKWEYQDLKDRLEDANKLLMKKDEAVKRLEQENLRLTRQAVANEAEAWSMEGSRDHYKAAWEEVMKEIRLLFDRNKELEEELAGMEKQDNTKWVYLEDVILSLLQASERMREVGKEIKNSRGLR